MSTALTIMRIQPLHKGHQTIIDTMLKENDKVFLMIGSVGVHNTKNPFSYDDRLEMVSALYEKYIKSGQLQIFAIADINNSGAWAEHVIKHLPLKPDFYYCGTGQDMDYFAGTGIKIKEFNREILPISATMIREKMSKNDNSWEEYVPEKIAEILKKKRLLDKKKQHTAMYCDFYHLTMAQALFNENQHNTYDIYEAFVRNMPFGGSYLVVAGLGDILEWLENWGFTDEDIEYLRVRGFKEEFLQFLKLSKLEVDIEAFPEGEIAFVNEPLIRVSGPAWQVMLLESGILNILNSQSLIATKTSRVCTAASCDGKKRPVMEFGLRRAQDQGCFGVSRAAYIGGSACTSNVEASRAYGIPASGTIAHCFIMRCENELEAFCNYLKAWPENGSLLIDTYDTINGAKNAVEASKITKIPLLSVRLDSGDLGYLSKKVREILDENGFTKTKIVVSNDLDEYSIQSLLLEQNAPVDSFGVGTKLVTAYDQPALGGVYKLKQTENIDVIKISATPAKTTIPGATDVIRILTNDGQFNGDIICSKKNNNFIKNNNIIKDIISVNLTTEIEKVFTAGCNAYNPIISVVEKGKINKTQKNRSLNEIKQAVLDNLEKLDKSHLRLEKPHLYIAGVEKELFIHRKLLREEQLKKENVL